MGDKTKVNEMFGLEDKRTLELNKQVQNARKGCDTVIKLWERMSFLTDDHKEREYLSYILGRIVAQNEYAMRGGQ